MYELKVVYFNICLAKLSFLSFIRTGIADAITSFKQRTKTNFKLPKYFYFF